MGKFPLAAMVRWRWRTPWAKDRAAPINARVQKVAQGPFFDEIWPHLAIIAINSWFDRVRKAGRETALPDQRSGPYGCIIHAAGTGGYWHKAVTGWDLVENVPIADLTT